MGSVLGMGMQSHLKVLLAQDRSRPESTMMEWTHLRYGAERRLCRSALLWFVLELELLAQVQHLLLFSPGPAMCYSALPHPSFVMEMLLCRLLEFVLSGPIKVVFCLV